MVTYSLSVNAISTKTNENRQHPLQYFKRVSLRGKATIHLNAEVLREGQISEKAEKQSCYSIVYL